ncbi:TIGR03089 family protein [Gordonia sp. DT30]|uniref:TIGR03089 family protein n=1 Tax=unclassified Gordonia (in: high G+C Gram-positive bacteria) TaxID=2657482 RepID=UPI003CF49B19
MTNSPTISAAIFGAIEDQSRPALTFYDDRSGERTELSWATLGNWAAKTANFLTDELGCVPGDAIVVDLPEHWQSAGILLGCWWAGAHVHTRATAATTDVPVAVFTDRTGLDSYPDADELIVAPLDPFALPVGGLPPGVSDYGSRVRIHGDHIVGPAYSGPALDGDAGPDVLAAARSAAAESAISGGSRVLSTREWRSAAGIVGNLLAPLAVGAGLVWVAHPSGVQAERAVTERAGIVLS